MHYNQGWSLCTMIGLSIYLIPPSGADLLTYMRNPGVFAVKNGHVEALTGKRLAYDHE